MMRTNEPLTIKVRKLPPRPRYNLRELAEALGRSKTHVYCVITGQRPGSKALRAELRRIGYDIPKKFKEVK